MVIFKNEKAIIQKIQPAIDIGLGYLQLNQPVHALSGGECQRLKIAKELSKFRKKTYKNTTKKTKHKIKHKINNKMHQLNQNSILYLFDEPSVGLAMQDLLKFIKILHYLIDNGHSIILIEHHIHLLASCDWLIELGPEGGDKGGYIIGEGTPKQISKMDTPTAPFLHHILKEEK